MGDRGNIIVNDPYGDGEVYLYSHWGGSELPQVVAAVLDRGERLDDGPYLTRIFFCAMISGDDLNGTTGYGISPSMGDGGTDIYVDLKEKVIRFNDEVFEYQQFIDNFKEV